MRGWGGEVGGLAVGDGWWAVAEEDRVGVCAFVSGNAGVCMREWQWRVACRFLGRDRSSGILERWGPGGAWSGWVARGVGGAS